MNLLDGFYTQLRVIHALVLRETRTRFGAHQLGYIWALVEPLMWVLTFGSMYYYMGSSVPYGMDTVGFLTTGIITFLMFRETMGRSLTAISANKAILFYPQIRPLDIVIARCALEMATFGMVFIIIMGANALYLGEFAIGNILNVVSGLFLAGLLGWSIGLFLGAISVYSKIIDRLVGIINRPLFWLSGLFYTANSASTEVRDIILWNPILHTVELVRDGWFSSYTAKYLDISYVMYWILGLGYVGLILERMARRKLELT